MYHEVPVERTIEDLYDGSLDDTEITDFISANIEAAQKEYNSVVKKAPKIGTDKARYLQEKKAYQAETDKAKAKVDYWQAVENERQRITHTSPEELKNAEDELSGEAARKEYRGITAGDEENPTSVEDLVRDFLRGAKITPEDFRKETGLSISEQKKFVGMISKQGKTIARLGEELADYDAMNLGGSFFGGDSNAARGAIIDTLLSSRTRGDFKQQDATAEEERYIEAVEQQREQWYYENYHMTYEEYLQYREIVLPELLRKYANFAPDILYPQFVASFEDAYAAEHSQTNNTENNEQQRNDTTAEESTTTPGDTVLQTEETNNSRGDSQSKEQPTEVPTGVRSSNENGTLPQSTPTEVDEPQPIGNSFFGKVYNQFKGKAKEAVNFLMRHRSGKLLGVFHRNDIGEISLVWGDEKGGLAHIISKHIVEQNDFNNIDEVINTMQQVINNGTITRENKDKVVIDYNDYRVAIRKQTRDNNGNVVEQGNWIVTAFDKSRSKKDKTPSEKTLSTPPSNQETDGVTLPSNGVPADKVTQSSQTKQEKENKFSPTPRKDGESITDYAERVAAEHQSYQDRKTEEAKVDTNPTEAQKEAGNYKKGHIKIDGLDITIEQPKGSIRRGTDANGKQWESEMHNTYGYIRGTESVDGDHIDIFLSDNPTEGKVFVVDQVNKDGSFDEHKVMYGFSDVESARQAYLSNYEEGWQGLGNITEVSKEEFKKWIDSSKRKTKPFAEYKSVKTQDDTQAQKLTEIPHLTEEEKREQRKQELRNKIKAKLRGQLNIGVDPELFMMGVELASMEIEDGVRKFADFTKKMIAEIGDEIRPYLKSIYNGARDLPGMEELSKEMTPYEEVKAFNIATIGDKGEKVKPSVLNTAEQINNEQTVERSAKEEAKNIVESEDVDNEAYSITKQHNNKKDIDIWVVRGEEHTDSDAFKERKQVAKKHNGYYSSFRGVNGFVFDTPEDAQSFADKVFDAKDEQINTETNENYAHNSEKVRKAINAYEEAQEKFDNLFSLLVKEKESKPFDSREWREVNRTKEELKDVLLQLNTKELGELLKQVSEKDTEHVIKDVLDIVDKQEHRLIAFNAILDKQGYITPEYKEEKKAIPVSEFVETDKKKAETHTILTGVFHDKGYVVGTDAYLLLARKEDYDKSLEEKVTNKKGEVINGKYPNWRAVVNSGKQGKSWGVNLEELHAFTRGVLTKLKTEKANPSTKRDAKIAFKTADGKIVLCYANALDKALQGAKSIGAKSIFSNDDVFAITQTPKGYVVCPMLSLYQNIDDNSFAYVPRVSELQHSTETLSNDTEAKRLATDTILSALNKAGIDVVRATDGQAQELLANTHATSLRTPQGTIYGWAVDGKIYLTEAGINPDTPIHEYTHLWAEAMMIKNKKGWDSIKALLKDNPIWNEVVADANYSNIADNEDAVASEILSRISGKKNAAKMEEEAQRAVDEAKGVFEKAEAATVLLNLKRALKQFWHWVGKNVFGIKDFKNIDEVTDRVLYDLLSNTKLNSGTVTTADGVSLPSRINVVEAEANHGFKNFDDGRKWAKENIARTYDNEETNGKGNIRISNTAIDKFMSEKAVAKSESKDVHMAVLKVLPDIIRESVDAEQREDRTKDENGIRKAGNTVNPDVMIHRLYGAVDIAGKIYRVKVTLKENVRTKETSKAYSYEATKIELLSGQSRDVTMTSPRNDNNSILTAKLLKDIEESYGKGVKLLKNDKSSDPRFQIVGNSLSDEEKKIVETAKANDTYMKAPNGKPTNLSEKQWAQVRTTPFKNWFGDWEKAARIEKLRRSKAVKITEADYNGKYELTRNSAKQWAKDNIRGEYMIADTGEKVNVAKVSINEVLSHGERDAAHLKSISAIGKMLHNAIFITETPNTKDNDKYESYRYYIEGVKIDSEDYTAKIVVGVKNGKTYYDHRLTQIEKGSLINSLNGLSNSVAEKQRTSFTGKDSKLLSILQTNSSKVVDENGEPMVAYHGSNNEFTKFDTARIGSSTGTSDGRGFYFTTDKDYANSFGKDGNVLSVFLNIDNPLSLKEKTITKRQLFDIIKRIDEKEVAADGEHWFISNYANYYDVGIDGAIREAAESEYPYSDNDVELVNSLISASGNFKDVVNSVYEITGKSSEIVPKENGTVHYVVTNPNQIKSATGNNGNFSTTEDDILYRTVFGGNSGYVGYSMSKRAAEAKEEGRYPKTEFRREYHITAKSLDMLTSLGFINNSEWHHTSMYGNKTPFYSWVEDELADDYLKHKKERDRHTLQRHRP